MDTPKTLTPAEQSMIQQRISLASHNLCILYNEKSDPEIESQFYLEIQETLDFVHKVFDTRFISERYSLYSFVERIKQMNLDFQPITCYNTHLTNLGVKRLHQFHAIICKEIEEIFEASSTKHMLIDQPVDIDFVPIADCLGDLVVFIFSEAARWGIPLLEVLSIIMDSQASKLVDGKPIPHPTEPGKFGKGPNYFPPEAKIRALLENYKQNNLETNQTNQNH